MAARLVGWIGPVVYLLAVTLAALFWLVAYPSCTDECASWGSGAPVGVFAPNVGTGTTGDGLSVVTTAALTPVVGDLDNPDPNDPVVLRAGFWVGLTSCLVALSWLLAMVWSAWQARHKTSDPDEDGLWSAHVLNVAFASRLTLLPLNVALFLATLHAATVLAHTPTPIAASSGGEGLLGVVTVALTGMMVALPAATYHLCAATRLNTRELLSSRAAVCQALLAIFPLAGFVALCWLQANGHAALRAAHDKDVAARTLRAYRASVSCEEDAPSHEDAPCTPTPTPAPTTSPSSSSTAAGTPTPR